MKEVSGLKVSGLEAADSFVVFVVEGFFRG
jgi:hypothetical protein